MEERLDPLHLAFSTPIAASQAGSRAVQAGAEHKGDSAAHADFVPGLPPTGKKRRPMMGADDSSSSGDSKDKERERLRREIFERDAEIANMSMQSSVFATLGAHSLPSSPHMSLFKSVPKAVPRSVPRRDWQGRESLRGADASGWTLPGARTPGNSMIGKGASTPLDKDAQIRMLKEVSVRWHCVSLRL